MTEESGFVSRHGQSIFLIFKVSRSTLEPTHPSVQWIPGALSLRVMRTGREADSSLPCNVRLSMLELYLQYPLHIHGVVLN
jgi:hypothetical protein